jgi:hypothetical protein
MKFLLLGILLLSSRSWANDIDDCKIIGNAANQIMVLHQSNVDIFIDFKSEDETPQQQRLDLMIADATSIPVYASKPDKKQAIQDFMQMWTNSCLESGDK